MLSNKRLQSDVLNQLRLAAITDNESDVNQIREGITSDEYFELMNLKNEPYSKFFTIHYAICSRSKAVIRALLQGLTATQKLQLCGRGVTENKGNALHIAVNNNLHEEVEVIRDVFFSANEVTSWIQLFTECEHTEKDTPAHYAARRGDIKFLEIFSRGLSSEAWYSILSKRNVMEKNVLMIYCVNATCKQGLNYFRNLQGPMEDALWLNLLNEKTDSSKTPIESMQDKFQLNYFEIINMKKSDDFLSWKPLQATGHGPRL